MSKNRNLKKGFSLVEALIALTLIALIFATATTAIVSTVNNRRYTEVKRFFINETQNYLECYKRDGKNKFQDNLNIMLDITAFTENDKPNNYYTYYTRSFESVRGESSRTYPDNAYFQIVVRIDDNGFFVTVFDIEQKKVYESGFPYVSRFDMQGA